MARTIPAVPLTQTAESTAMAPGSSIIAGTSAGALGRVLDLAKLANLAYSTVCAHPVWAQAWPDGQATQGATAGAYVLQTAVRIPELSAQHTTLTVSIYAASPSGTGLVRFRAVNAATNVVLAPAVAAGWVQGTLSVAGGFGPGYEQVEMDWQDDVTVYSVRVIYEHIDPTGLWPAADGALPAGILDTIGVDTYAMDTVEVSAERPLTAAALEKLNAIVTSVASRKRTIVAAAAPIACAPALAEPTVAYIPHRCAVITDDARTVRIYAQATEIAGLGTYLIVMAGAQTRIAIAEGSALIGRQAMVGSGRSRLGADGNGLFWAALATAWDTAAITLPEVHNLDRRVARENPVATRLEWREGVNPAVGAASMAVGGQQMDVTSFSAWEVP